MDVPLAIFCRKMHKSRKPTATRTATGFHRILCLFPPLRELIDEMVATRVHIRIFNSELPQETVQLGS
jgi:hypothetical protein